MCQDQQIVFAKYQNKRKRTCGENVTMLMVDAWMVDGKTIKLVN